MMDSVKKERLLKLVKTAAINLAVFVLIVSIAGFFMSRNLPTEIEGSDLVEPLTPTGAPFNLPSAGEKIRVVYFFAPWCGVCKFSSKNVEVAATQFSRVELSYIGLEYETEEDLLKFAREANLQSAVYRGTASVQQRWNIQSYPTYFILDPSGKIISAQMGYSSIIGVWIRVLLATWFH
jgi:thiol-disulfide isomerase/thioredoxin